MRPLLKLLLVLPFAALSLAPPHLVLCFATGPDGHVRLESDLAPCCGEHDAQDPAGRHEAHDGCCGICTDLGIGIAETVRAAPPEAAPAAPALALPVPESLRPVPALRKAPARLPGGATGPPLFLSLHALRI